MNEAPDARRNDPGAQHRPARDFAQFDHLLDTRHQCDTLFAPGDDELGRNAVRINERAEENIGVENDTHQARLAKRSLRTSSSACSISSSILRDGTAWLCACAAPTFRSNSRHATASATNFDRLPFLRPACARCVRSERSVSFGTKIVQRTLSSSAVFMMSHA